MTLFTFHSSKARNNRRLYLSLLLLVFSSLQVSAGGSATGITLSEKNAPLEKVFKEIKKQSGYSFWYENSVLRNARNVDISLRQASLDQTLAVCFSNQPLSYHIVGNVIVVEQKTPEQNPAGKNKADIIIKGRVTDETGAPLPSVSVMVKGTTNGVSTNAEGMYSIAVPDNQTILVFRSVGYLTKEVAAGSAILNISLSADTQNLNEVAVTALGIKRDRRSLGYSAQEIKGDAITGSHQPNIVNALQGQAAGLQINSGGGAPGSGAKIILRGLNSMDPNRDFQPLFVIDGIPIDNSTDVSDNSELMGISNRAADINPDDIETINVLKGGAATALYGLRAATGAIIITTKSGKAGKMRVNYTSTFSSDVIDKYPETQDKYTQGFLGVYDPTSFWPSLGPKITEAQKTDPTVPDHMFNNYKHGYETGHSYRNSLNLSGGTDKAIFTAAFSQFNQTGIMPFTDYKNYSAKLGAEFKISDKVSFGSSLNYIKSGGRRANSDRYNETLTYFSGRWDIWDYLNPNGTQKTIIGSTNDNPIYLLANKVYKDDVDRVISNSHFTYTPVKWLDISYRFGVDTYNDSRTSTTPGPIGLAGEIYPNDFGFGTVNEYRAKNTVLNSTLMLNFKNDIGRHIKSSFKVGHDIYSTTRKSVNTSGDTLVVSNFYNLSNAKRVVATNNTSEYRIMGLFGDWSLSYDSFLYLDITGRNDWTSTLPKDNRSFFYPSVSASWVFSENFKLPDWISSGRIRLSLAQIGKDAYRYATSSGYTIGTPLSNGVLPFTQNPQTGDANLRPEKTKSYEAGTELRFFKNRLGLDLTYYNNKSTDLIIPVNVPVATGYDKIYLNSGSIRNRGLEISLSGTPLQSRDFSWTVNANYTHNKNTVLSIYPGLTEIVMATQFGYLSSTVTQKYIPGMPVGALYGRTYKRYGDTGTTLNTDLPMVIGADGFPVLNSATTQQYIANSQPKWIGSIGNTFKYKNWSLYALFDTQQGVYRYNQLANFMAAFALQKSSENREDFVVFPGVLADGTPNTKSVWLGQGLGPDGVNYGNGYYRNVYRGASETFIEDASWVRLRTATLSYNLPAKFVQRSGFLNGATLSFTGNNLWISTKFTGFDPESSSTNSGSVTDGFAGFTYPAIRSYIVSLNVNF
ncbi:MAG: SusC/RagA family TonB-linked outer membrane protein [Pedobacter sp.]|uniref:SusC/RagA family TonB-linked outer membrane protein n=1 Tax=Pedobacter sp. TaxID=1411316 RepID=UPI0033928144